MKPSIRIASAMFDLAALAGCASTRMTSTQPYTGAPLARPDRILVYDFGAAPGDVPADSALAPEAAGAAPQTAEDIEVGRKLAAEGGTCEGRGLKLVGTDPGRGGTPSFSRSDRDLTIPEPATAMLPDLSRRQ